jgi:probable F420-dependent oxidoreductase
MEYGVVFPQTEFGHDLAAIRDYTQTAEALGYRYILAYDHVLGANPNRPGGWSGPYTHETPFMEPFVLFSYMAALAPAMGFATGILILPQRQTALVAKQAATLDILCGGKLRLGVGLGWNSVEYEALGEDFHNRGKRVEEQVHILRRLWTLDLVDFNGRWHTISNAGINPLPVQQPIPIWFGGSNEAVYDRIARLGDGWMVNSPVPGDAAPVIRKIRARMVELNRDPSRLGIEARIPYGSGDPGALKDLILGWKEAGATHVSINTMGAHLSTPAEHIQALEKFMKVIKTMD